MLKVFIPCAATALTIVSAPVSAAGNTGTSSGNELLSTCDAGEQKDMLSFGLCAGFITGVEQGLKLASELNKSQMFCEPNGVTNGQIRDVAVNYIRSHAANRHLSSSTLIALALVEAFPCPK